MMTRLELAKWVGQGLAGPLLVSVEQMLHDLLVLLDAGEQPLLRLLVVDIVDIENGLRNW